MQVYQVLLHFLLQQICIGLVVLYFIVALVLHVIGKSNGFSKNVLGEECDHLEASRVIIFG